MGTAEDFRQVGMLSATIGKMPPSYKTMGTDRYRWQVSIGELEDFDYRNRQLPLRTFILGQRIWLFDTHPSEYHFEKFETNSSIPEEYYRIFLTIDLGRSIREIKAKLSSSLRFIEAVHSSYCYWDEEDRSINLFTFIEELDYDVESMVFEKYFALSESYPHIAFEFRVVPGVKPEDIGLSSSHQVYIKTSD